MTGAAEELGFLSSFLPLTYPVLARRGEESEREERRKRRERGGLSHWLSCSLLCCSLLSSECLAFVGLFRWVVVKLHLSRPLFLALLPYACHGGRAGQWSRNLCIKI